MKYDTATATPTSLRHPGQARRGAHATTTLAVVAPWAGVCGVPPSPSPLPPPASAKEYALIRICQLDKNHMTQDLEFTYV